MDTLFERVAACLAATSVEEKLVLTHATAQAWRDGALSLESAIPPEPIAEPGRPDRPVLVAPSAVPRRRLGTPEGRMALLHAVAHIEFNAINLAWDAAYRFRDLPLQYYHDWVRVADEEARHFGLLQQRLRELGHEYGDLPAHNGLWEMAAKTAFDPMVRMALVPRVLEARGLDVTPGMIQKLHNLGDEKSVAVLETILHDEVFHVEIGSYWFKHFCDQRGLNVQTTFAGLIEQYRVNMRGPFNEAARLQAGFTAVELASFYLLPKVT